MGLTLTIVFVKVIAPFLAIGNIESYSSFAINP